MALVCSVLSSFAAFPISLLDTIPSSHVRIRIPFLSTLLWITAIIQQVHGQNCPAGQYASKGGCSSCPQGIRKAIIAVGTVRQQSIGTYSPTSGSSECIAPPAGTIPTSEIVRA